MSEFQCAALVFFGATGDLAYKKIVPALQAMIKRGNLNVPVIGVAKAGWNLDRLLARAHDSLEKHGGVDPAAFATLSGLLCCIDGDYKSPATFAALREKLKDARHPAHYLAIPPVLFQTVVQQITESNCGRGAVPTRQEVSGGPCTGIHSIEQLSGIRSIRRKPALILNIKPTVKL